MAPPVTSESDRREVRLSPAGDPGRAGKLLAILSGVLVAGYPLAVYVGLSRFGPRQVGIVLALLLAPTLVLKARRARREDLLAVLRVPLSVFGLLALSAWLDDARLVFALPVLINLALLAQFAGSLRATPLVEHFARLQHPTLSEAQVRYCRIVTKVWCWFFVLNALTSATLAWTAPLALWALYNGLLAYLLMGMLAGAEYVVRKARFREYGLGFWDRQLARLFPPSSELRP